MTNKVEGKETLRKKRATSEEPIVIDTSTEATTLQSTRRLIVKLVGLVEELNWNYKTNKTLYLSRDKALLAFLFLTGCRISEALKLKRKQFYISEAKIIVLNVETLKRGILRDEIDLPKIGALSKLTFYVETWLEQIKEPNNHVFPRGNSQGVSFNQPIGRKRAYQIVAETGIFPHWARAVCETIYGKAIFKDAYELKQFMGLKRLDSTTPYVQSNWKTKRKRVNLL